MYHWRPHIIWENLDSHIKTHNQHRLWKGDRTISNGKGSLGHWHLLQLQWTLNLKVKLTWLLSYSVQSVLSYQSHVCCIVGKARDFTDWKINKPIAVSEAVDDSWMWKESWTYRLFIKCGICGYLPLTLFAHHTYGPRCPKKDKVQHYKRIVPQPILIRGRSGWGSRPDIHWLVFHTVGVPHLILSLCWVLYFVS